MHRYSRLRMLERTASKRFRKIRNRAHLVRVAPGWQTYQVEAEVTALAIDLLNVWANCMRWFFVSCALGCKSVSGTTVRSHTPCTNHNDAIGRAVQRFRPHATPNSLGAWDKRDEPPWHDPFTVMQLANAEGLANRHDVAAAFSTGFNVFNDLPVFRNYFAHRNRRTREAAMTLAPKYSVGVTGKPSDVLRSVPSGKAASVLEDWADSLLFTLEYLCH